MKRVGTPTLAILLIAALAPLVFMQPLAAQQQRIVIRFGTQNPVGHPVDVGARRAAEIIERQSGGRIQLQIFPGDQLGSQPEQMANTIRGSQDMYLSTAAWLAPYFGPVGVLDANYLFSDADHLFRVMKGRVGQELFKQLPSAVGVRIVDVWYFGARHFTSNKPFRTPAELGRLKTRVANAPIFIENARCMGANPTPMGIGEVYLALKTGVVDAQENPLTNILNFKFFEVSKYLILTAHQIGSFIPSINERAWQSLGPEGQKILLTAFEEGGKANNALVYKAEAELVAQFKAAGMEVITPDPEPFRQMARKCLPEKFGNVWGQGLYEAIQSSGR